MSNYVVIARFDEAANRNIVRLRRQMEEAGFDVPEWPPHITLAAYEDIDAGLLCDWTAGFAARQTARVEVGLHAVGLFPPGGPHRDTVVLYLAPAHAKVLVDFYYAFHAKYEEYCTGIGWYNSISHGQPAIHSTIAVVPVERIQKAMELVMAGGVFGKAKIVALEVYTYPMRLIRRFELPGES